MKLVRLSVMVLALVALVLVGCQVPTTGEAIKSKSGTTTPGSYETKYAACTKELTVAKSKLLDSNSKLQKCNNKVTELQQSQNTCEREFTGEINLVNLNDESYILKWKDSLGDVSLPLAYVDNTGLHLGQKPGYDLALSGPIGKNDYFIVTSGFGAAAKSYALQYTGSDKVTDTDPKIHYKVLATGEGHNRPLSSTGEGDIVLGGTRFIFRPAYDGNSDDFDIFVDLDGSGIVSTQETTAIWDAAGKSIGISPSQLELGNQATISISHEITSIKGVLRCTNWAESNDDRRQVCNLDNEDVVEVSYNPGHPTTFKYKY